MLKTGETFLVDLRSYLSRLCDFFHCSLEVWKYEQQVKGKLIHGVNFAGLI